MKSSPLIGIGVGDFPYEYQKVNDIYLLGKQAGCEFWGIEKDKIGHTMQSVFINKQRKILGKWEGENWDQKMERWFDYKTMLRKYH